MTGKQHTIGKRWALNGIKPHLNGGFDSPIEITDFFITYILKGDSELNPIPYTPILPQDMTLDWTTGKKSGKWVV